MTEITLNEISLRFTLNIVLTHVLYEIIEEEEFMTTCDIPYILTYIWAITRHWLVCGQYGRQCYKFM